MNNNNNNNILLVGGLGLVGKKVAKELIKNGVKNIKVTTRDINKRDDSLDPFVEFVEFDFNRPETFKSAIENVNKIFTIIPPSDLNADKVVTPFFEYIKANSSNQIKQFLFLSGSTDSSNEKIPIASAEKLVKSLGIDYVIVSPTFFIDNFSTYLRDSIKSGFVINPTGNGKTAWNSTQDIGEVCSILLSNDQMFNKYKNQLVTLSSLESITLTQIVELISQHLNKPIVVKDVTLDQYRDILIKFNLPDSAVEFLPVIYSSITNGSVDYVDNNIQDITGHKPISPEEYIISNLSDWQ